MRQKSQTRQTASEKTIKDIRRHLISRRTLRIFRNQAMAEWKFVTSAASSVLALSFGRLIQVNLTDPEKAVR